MRGIVNAFLFEFKPNALQLGASNNIDNANEKRVIIVSSNIVM